MVSMRVPGGLRLLAVKPDGLDMFAVLKGLALRLGKVVVLMRG